METVKIIENHPKCGSCKWYARIDEKNGLCEVFLEVVSADDDICVSYEEREDES